MENNFSLLMRMKFLIFYNERLKTPKKRSGTISIVILIIAAIYIFSEIFYNRIFSNIIEENYEFIYAVIPAFLSIFLSIIFFIQIIESLKNLLPNFYKTPDFQYLISMPIHMKDIMTLRFLSHIFKTNRFFFFVYLTIIIAFGKSIEFQWHMYLALIFAYVLIVITPTLLGIIIGMSLLRFMKVSSYNKLMGTVSFTGNIIFWVLFFRSSDIMERFSVMIMRVFENDFIVNLIPVFSVSNFVTNIYFSNYSESIKYLFFAILVTILIGFLGYFIVNKTYYKGWINVTNDFSQKSKKRGTTTIKKDFSQKSLMGTILKYEITRGIKNKEMIWPFITCIIFQYSIIAIFTFTGILENYILLQIAIILLASDFFANAAAEVLFLPIEAATDKKLIKNRLIFYKYFPIDEKVIYLTTFLKSFIISLILCVPGTILFGVFNSLGIVNIIILVLYQIALLFTTNSINNALDKVYISKYIFKKDFYGNLIYYLTIIVVYFFTLGLLALYAFDFQFYHNTIFEPLLSFILNNRIFMITISVITMLLSIVLSKKIGEKAWLNTEF